MYDPKVQDKVLSEQIRGFDVNKLTAHHPEIQANALPKEEQAQAVKSLESGSTSDREDAKSFIRNHYRQLSLGTLTELSALKLKLEESAAEEERELARWLHELAEKGVVRP